MDRSTETYLFVDIDGVLNTRSYLRKQIKTRGKCSRFKWCPEAVKHLNSLCTNFDSRLVISSSWRYEFSLEELRNIFSKNGISSEWIIGTTPSMVALTVEENHCRGHEIDAWLREEGSKPYNYLILDDLETMLPHQEKFLIRTEMDHGFADPALFQKAQSILKGADET